ncbi:MAG TPA: hypothetical protein VJT68_10460 [Thermoleophilaceae bacterium]|nr:hypothetical protein [Thermoleophilaceae bacterium]
MEREGDAQEPRFLPPEPPGPEPDIARRPQAAPPEPPPPPPPPQQTYGYPPPPPGAPAGAAPPPGYGGYQAPPPGWGQPPQWAWQPPVPDNGQAVTGFVFSIVGVGLLVISFGLSSIVSVGCAITGIICSRNGKKKVERGETPKHKGLAQAGYIVGWVGLALSVLATAGWILAIVLGAIDENSGGGGGTPAHLRSAVAVAVGG